MNGEKSLKEGIKKRGYLQSSSWEHLQKGSLFCMCQKSSFFFCNYSALHRKRDFSTAQIGCQLGLSA
ncbi:hypothetical protein ACFL9U_03675 [Thermodesulfobacteriota bacterium]